MTYPLEISLESSACAYYQVPGAFFQKKGKDGHAYKRRILYFLLYTDAEMSIRAIARKYNFCPSSIRDGIESITFLKTQSANIENDLKNIRHLASQPITPPPITVATPKKDIITQAQTLRATGLTQRAIAKKLNISPSTVNKYLKQRK